MAIYDITLPLRPGMTIWPGHPEFENTPVSEIAKGKRSNVSRLVMSTHTGTHVDPPYHFLADGGTLDELPLERLIGPADVVEALDVHEITASVLNSLPIPADCQRLLLHTRNSGIWESGDSQFRQDYVGITEDAAHWLVDHGLGLVGTDYLGIHRIDLAIPVHHILLGAEIVVLEGLNLAHIRAGRYQLIALPLRIAGGDGAPVRAILMDMEA